MQEKYNKKVPKVGDVTIQEWLSDQSSPDTGCPLVDAPFIFEAEDDSRL
jgi:hypothetical protein